MSDDLHQTASGKRRDVISWDEFFMSVAIAAQRRSKDPNTQVGACIANTNHRILSVMSRLVPGDKLSSNMRCRYLATNAAQRAPSQIDYS